MSGVRFKPKISEQRSVERIAAFAMHGEHPVQPRPRSIIEVLSLIESRGISPDGLARQLRNTRLPVPLFENLLKPGLKTRGAGTRVQLVDPTTGRPEGGEMAAPGTIVVSNYAELFESAFEALHRAVDSGAYRELQTGLSHGIDAIEGFIGSRAEAWNRPLAADSPNRLVDTKASPVRLEDKIVEWTRIITAQPLNKGTKTWARFKEARDIRDNVTVHSKESAFTVTWVQFARHANLFRDGVARLLLELHILHQVTAPSRIVRAAFEPDIEAIPVDEPTT